LLFSGGLDSLSAAIRELEAGAALTLVSHYTGNTTTIASQRGLLDYLAGRFGAIHSLRVKVGGRTFDDLGFPDDAAREPSQRVLAAIVARRTGNRRVMMVAENGPLAIHLALSTARLGPFSTHTAHPEYLVVAETLLRNVLGVDLTIENPFLYLTKAQVVEPVVTRHAAAVPPSVSCWRGSRQAINHCGDCVPCLVRRLALEGNGYVDDEYARDLLNVDLTALAPDDDAALVEAFPELLNPRIDQAEAIGMYRRFGAEVIDGVRRHPRAAGLVGP
jgi:7-cyano-7-deazaguanine synthase in queuosine biosynthesis